MYFASHLHRDAGALCRRRGHVQLRAEGPGNTYTYDANGNQVERVVDGTTYIQDFNAEHIGKTSADLVALWNDEHPGDPVEE